MISSRFTLHTTPLLLLLLFVTVDGWAQKQPNIVLLFSDDAGYADFGFQGSDVMKTPNLDQLAKQGVRCSQAYVTASTCGPSRAGLLTGRYQQKFGFEENNVPSYMSPNSALDGDNMGVPVDQKTIGNQLQKLGYKTAIFGKWHLGGADCFHPLQRGFDEFYGFRGGARSYYAYPKPPKEHLNKLERNFNDFTEPQRYLTDRLGEEACDFIERNKENPFFAFVSFNAVHTPMEAEPKDMAEFPNLKGKRQQVAAMTLALDRACGKILDKLKALGLEENTIVIFTNDNGGPTDKNASINLPLAGTKSNHLEGGLRVPFIMKWPHHIKKNSTYRHPISTFDLLPTFVAAGGGNSNSLKNVDGVDITPYLSGQKSNELPHEFLFWKKDCRATVRQGDWKLIRYPDRPAELYNIEKDESEQNNVASEYPDRVREMYKKIFEWESTLERPRWMLQRKFENVDIDRMDKYRTVTSN